MTTRTDIHRPATLTTEDYVEIGFYDLGTETERPMIRLSEEVNYDSTLWGGQYGEDLTRCDHCGQHGLRYGAEMLHRPTGTHIHVGETCLGNRFGRATAEFQSMRKAAQLDRERQRILTEWNEYRSTHEADWEALDASANLFIQDVLRKGRQYGNLSDRQFEAICKALAKDAEKGEAPVEPTIPVIEGKVQVEGEVLTVKWQPSPFGYNAGGFKMLVKVMTEQGSYKVWGTVPSSLDVEKGQVVRFTATVQRSDDDETFGFFKRPTKAEIVEVAA